MAHPLRARFVDLLILIPPALGVAAAGLLSVGLAHSLTIVPIWDQLFNASPFALALGLSIAWWVHRDRGRMSPLVLGGVLWLGQVPVTLWEVVLRTRLADQRGWLEMPSELAILVLTAVFLARWIYPGWLDRFALVGAVFLTGMAMGGALPISESSHALRFFLGWLPALVISCWVACVFTGYRLQR